MNESELIQKDLEDLKNNFGAKVQDTIDITSFLVINIKPSAPNPNPAPIPDPNPAPNPVPDPVPGPDPDEEEEIDVDEEPDRF
jgi:hypothetical protein